MRRMGDWAMLAAYDAVIADIYEAALSPSHWDVALAGIINRSAPPMWDVAFLIWENIAPPSGRFVGTVGVNDFARAGYLQAFVGRNPWSEQAHGLPTGTVVHTDELVARDQFRKSMLYQAYLSNWNLDVAIIGQVDRSGASRLGLVLPGPDTGDISNLFDAVRRYLPHIQRATRISRKLGEANLRAANAEAALERSIGPTIILSEDLEILFANSHAQALLDHGYASERGGRLSLTDPAIIADLKMLAKGSAQAPSMAFSLEVEGKPEFRILAMRIETPLERTLGGTIDGGAILLVGSRFQGGVRAETMENYIHWFGLTPTEARLAAMLAQGNSLEDFANSRGVSINAGRFLLKGIFAKTGTSKQAQLVSLLRDAPDGWIQGQIAAE
jgi:DNA-binding CsgD family transcriptional regulator